ncbi:MAG TPA: hypothetical protein VGH54_26495 [Mycobacterium sp.]|uniref:hypothetical protein n=1 Tax=Mycobacterium sp. TaxID=1785 RepID=UPI002F4035CC
MAWNPTDPFAPGRGRPLDKIEWAIPDKHVAALNVLARHAKDADELCKFADMLGFGTEEMRARYERGVELRRTART